MGLTWHLFLLVFLLHVATITTTTTPRRTITTTTPTLISEYKISQCLVDNNIINTEYEASGIITVKNQLYIVFDNMATVAIVDNKLSSCATSSATLLHLPVSITTFATASTTTTTTVGREIEVGFEAISSYNGTFVVVQEIDAESSTLQARVQTFTPDFATQLSNRLLDYTFDTENKGIEGVALLSIQLEDMTHTHFLFALCEGNHCAAGIKGQAAGHGTILVYYQNNQSAWMSDQKIHLPRDLHFQDFSGLDVRPRTAMSGDLAVVSQESHGLFVGKYVITIDTRKPSGYAFHLSKEVEDRTVYEFPARYCNIEGITFLETVPGGSGSSGSSGSGGRWVVGPVDGNGNKEEQSEREEEEQYEEQYDLIGVVSDKRKRHQSKHCDEKDQSVHIFHLSKETNR